MEGFPGPALWLAPIHTRPHEELPVATLDLEMTGISFGDPSGVIDSMAENLSHDILKYDDNMIKHSKLDRLRNANKLYDKNDYNRAREEEQEADDPEGDVRLSTEDDELPQSILLDDNGAMHRLTGGKCAKNTTAPVQQATHIVLENDDPDNDNPDKYAASLKDVPGLSNCQSSHQQESILLYLLSPAENEHSQCYETTTRLINILVSAGADTQTSPITKRFPITTHHPITINPFAMPFLGAIASAQAPIDVNLDNPVRTSDESTITKLQELVASRKGKFSVGHEQIQELFEAAAKANLGTLRLVEPSFPPSLAHTILDSTVRYAVYTDVEAKEAIDLMENEIKVVYEVFDELNHSGAAKAPDSVSRKLWVRRLSAIHSRLVYFPGATE
ncbi:hypothetical protein DL770_001210 [Monosporascus sp. CRB-9-2]|nr:hypothetical protein DL770_001210 [Monosporascus sp. CRB-9-2]